ncbi:hypothetical protein ABDK00_018160 [Niabella insulamsoli]|uniref:hypothetical protein n=1 Tax=Niabella insulamsoli TaxID=3144874 RepID=UPI0031FBE842
MGQSEDIKKPLKDWLEDFHDDTGKISDLVRNLALAAIGIIWIFKNTDLTHNIIPKELVLPLKFVVIGLLLDLFQYVWRAINIYIIYSIKAKRFDEGKLTDAEIADVKVPNYIPFLTWLFFIAKIIFVAIAYYNIYLFLMTKI